MQDAHRRGEQRWVTMRRLQRFSSVSDRRVHPPNKCALPASAEPCPRVRSRQYGKPAIVERGGAANGASSGSLKSGTTTSKSCTVPKHPMVAAIDRMAGSTGDVAKAGKRGDLEWILNAGIIIDQDTGHVAGVAGRAKGCPNIPVGGIVGRKSPARAAGEIKGVSL